LNLSSGVELLCYPPVSITYLSMFYLSNFWIGNHTVLLLCVLSRSLLARILVVANSFVHVLMYYYYSMATVGRTVWWKKYITQAQIVQFIIDLTATWPYPFLYFSAAGCSGSMRGWLFGQAVGLSFFKLFRDFYLRSYQSSRARIAKDIPHHGAECANAEPPEKSKPSQDDSPKKIL
jgi:hypothetical protein